MSGLPARVVVASNRAAAGVYDDTTGPLIVEEYDATYWEPARSTRKAVESMLLAGREHVFESEMKDRRRTDGRRHHERRPDAGA